MALGLTQPLTEMSTRLFPGGKGGRCLRLTNLPTSCAVVMKSGNLNFLEPSGPVQECNGIALLLPFNVILCLPQRTTSHMSFHRWLHPALHVFLWIQTSWWKLNARHPDVLLKTIKIYKYRQNTTKFIILYHFWTTCFDSLESSSGPLLNWSKTI